MSIATGAVEVLDTRDPQRAADLDTEDDVTDQPHGRLLAQILAPDWNGGTVAAVDLPLCAATTNASPTTPWKSGAAPSTRAPDTTPSSSPSPFRFGSGGAPPRYRAWFPAS
ncbi:hypothetical protein ACWEKT_40660 [Nocardia takedensis]